jgi:hypothetical protein
MPRGPQWWARELKAGSSVMVCTRCHAIYYDKHWHTWSNGETRLPVGAKITESLCGACASINSNRGKTSTFGFEGEVILSGLAEGSRKQEMMRLVRNIGSRAVRRDPEDQIIKIEDKGNTVRITTTENQLAISIGKQVERAFKGGTLVIRWSNEDLPARVTWKERS